MALTNPWIGYVIRSYDQIKENVLTKFQALVLEITDHTETNPWVKMISIWSGLIEMLGYYVDSNAEEVYITTAKEFESAVKIARMFDYRVKGPVPASVDLTFTSSIAATGDITIPAGTKCTTEDGLIFITTEEGTIETGETEVVVPAKQWEPVLAVALGTSDGSPDQAFELEEDVADGSVAIKVGVQVYTAQETFAFSFATSQHFIAGLQEDTKMNVLFGDGVNGKIPPAGQAITADYYVTSGDAGNIGADLITEITDTITVPGSEQISVTNELAATGGASYEDLTKLKKRIPLSIRTKYRAVTRQDFIDVTELFAGVEKAGVEFDCDVDKYVHIYLVPEGGGPASQALIDDVTAYLEIRKIITTLIQVQSAGQLGIRVMVAVKASPGYSNAAVKAAVEAALVAFGDSENQDIKGSVVFGDVYQAIEDVQGVVNSDISLLLAIPAARNLTTPTTNLDWDRAIQSASSIVQRWLIRFITDSQYELFRGDDFVGSYNVDVEVTQPEIVFTVNGDHDSGDNYEFYTYPYNQSIYLAEPSIPFVDVANLTVTVTGGV